VSDREAAAYYDRLSRWTRMARHFGYGGGRRQLTVHRALVDPRARGRPTTTRLHDVIVEALPAMDAPRVLDAGCGFGGTILDLAERIRGSYVGITLSREQAEIARRAIDTAGLSRRVRIEVRSYDDPPAGPFDLILAVESLAHSPNPSRSVSALAGTLAPGGLLAVVDDMPRSIAGTDPDLVAFKAGWRCPALWSGDDYARRFSAAGLEIVADRDLTGSYRPRSFARIRMLEAVNRAARAVVPSPAWREVMDSYFGGLALERLYRRNLMQYRLLIARSTSRL